MGWTGQGKLLDQTTADPPTSTTGGSVGNLGTFKSVEWTIWQIGALCTRYNCFHGPLAFDHKIELFNGLL